MALQLADGETQLGRGTQGVEEEDVEIVRREDVGDALGEHARIVAAVVADGDADTLAREILLEIIGQALRSGADGIDVHAVGTHAHDAAQTARTELEVLVETLDELLHVVVQQVLDLLLGRLVVMPVEPSLRLAAHQLFYIVCHKIH